MKPDVLNFFCTTCGHSWSVKGSEATEEVIKGINSSNIWIKYQVKCPNCGLECNTVVKQHPKREKVKSLWNLMRKK